MKKEVSIFFLLYIFSVRITNWLIASNMRFMTRFWVIVAFVVVLYYCQRFNLCFNSIFSVLLHIWISTINLVTIVTATSRRFPRIEWGIISSYRSTLFNFSIGCLVPIIQSLFRLEIDAALRDNASTKTKNLHVYSQKHKYVCKLKLRPISF